MRSIRATIFAMLIAFAPGCLVTGRATVRTQPSMVLIEDDVYVIEDYNEPVFYSNGVYYRYYGDVWYTSSYHTGGWVVIHSPPGHIHRIHNPRGYVHYRAKGSVKRQKVRDHRQDKREHRKEKRENKRPKVRDHRR